MTFISIVEDIRSTHQELDRLRNLLTKLLLNHAKSDRDRLLQSHRANYLVNLINQRSTELLEFYLDSDNSLSDEAHRISKRSINPSTTLTDQQQQQVESGGMSSLKEFYNRLDQLHQFHIKYPQQKLNAQNNSSNSQPSDSLDGFDWSGLEAQVIDGRDFIDRMFTGEEMLGRFLDLHLHHDRYNNLTGLTSSSSNNQSNSLRRLPYISYIDSFDQFDSIPRSTKSKPEYQKYLEDLRDYLKSFINRTEPLYDLETDLKQLGEQSESNWSKGLITSWQGEAQQRNEGIWCDLCLKSYSKQTVYDGHLSSKKHKKALQRAKHQDTDTSKNGGGEDEEGEGDGRLNLRGNKNERDRFLCRLELEIQHCSKHLTDKRNETKSNVERRSALTDRERQQELLEFESKQRLGSLRSTQQQRTNQDGTEAGHLASGGMLEGGGEEDDDDDESRVYNPLKLPLGWDGKPIPYWLYKLHGLGVEYKCEICSDFIYMGRKNFERHFQESRHAFGMRALGLPNTKHFHEITKIEDAFALAEKLKSEGRAEIFRDETMEELEDEEGNVYNRKTYEDLKRQGLL
ncbi:hypothetical protein BY996DRAFT_4581731 [Phakopsora pachyrhizi]|nr:hypothetical protein BY996DRAFT_4581731 [Phakopsora pachyrhizi]